MAYRAMSAAYSNLGYQSEAERRLDRAFELKDRVSERERHYIEADYYRRSEQTFDKAIDAYEKLLAVYPDDHVGNNNLGVVYNSIEEYEKAIECFEVNVRNQTQNYHSYSNLATAYLNTGRLRKAEGVARHYLSDVMDHPQIRNSLAQTLMYQRKFSTALEETEKALTLDAGALDAIVTKANVLFLTGDLSGARVEYTRLLDNEQPIAHLFGRTLLTEFYSAQGQLQEAELQLRQGLDLSKMMGEESWVAGLQAQLGYLLAVQGRAPQALQACRSAVQSAQESGTLSKQRDVLFNLAVVELMLDQTTEARQTARSLQQVTAQGLNLKAMRYVYLINGLLLGKAGNHTEAVEEFKRARELMPLTDGTQVMLSDAMGTTLWASGEPDKALKIFSTIQRRPLARLDNGYLYARSFYQSARLLQEMGDTEEARSFYGKFLELWADADPDIPLLVDARQQLEALSR
jgi:tetratricopeptide (TPR) repeat protein